jgi:two-component system, OmpR family, response regulator BaeR
MRTAKILVVEDEAKISDLICKYLLLEGYDYAQVFDGVEALKNLDVLNPALIILDVMLPGLDGLSVCEKIREKSDVPIILLTARVQDVDRLMGFARGADDYVSKPFNPQELMARIKAILRRSTRRLQSATQQFEDLVLYVDEYRATVKQQELQLTQIEFKLLSVLVGHPTKVFTREELLVGSHGKYSESYERTIDFHIKNLRRKINIDDSLNYIKSVYGVGYKLI